MPVSPSNSRSSSRVSATTAAITSLWPLRRTLAAWRWVLLDVGTKVVSELLEELQSSTAGKWHGGKKWQQGGPGSRSGKMWTMREEAKPLQVHEDEEAFWRESDHMGSPPPQQGRGKMVPLSSQEGTGSWKIFVPSDPADARAALLSKRSVHSVAAWQRLHVKLFADSDGEEILCICHRKDDGQELVQCEDCWTWYHLECLGIRDIADLGREEDPWYYHSCVTLRLQYQSQCSHLSKKSHPFAGEALVRHRKMSLGGNS